MHRELSRLREQRFVDFDNTSKRRGHVDDGFRLPTEAQAQASLKAGSHHNLTDCPSFHDDNNDDSASDDDVNVAVDVDLRLVLSHD